jgi:hypothetical protein
MKKSVFYVLLLLWSVTLILFTIFSYTQVDLNLTLLNWNPYLAMQFLLTKFGYFNRPANFQLFLFLSTSLLIQYIHFVYLAAGNKLSGKKITTLIAITSGILFFTYTVFSHDLFNYIFDARILTKYGLNPYEHKALEFPADTWTRFMHWTHRNYPYGPLWLLITAVPSYLGIGKLILTLAAFKALFIMSYLACTLFIYKTSQLLDKSRSQVTTIVFALSPLILFDGIVSPHVDITMAALFSIAIYYLVRFYYGTDVATDKLKGFIWLLLSIAVKFATVFYIPIFLLNPKKIGLTKWLFYLSLVSFIGAIAQSYQGRIYSWYFIIPMVCLSITGIKYNYTKVLLFTVLLSVAMFISYGVFIQTGMGVGLFQLSPK